MSDLQTMLGHAMGGPITITEAAEGCYWITVTTRTMPINGEGYVREAKHSTFFGPSEKFSFEENLTYACRMFLLYMLHDDGRRNEPAGEVHVPLAECSTSFNKPR